jgi:hypothetical protein
MRLRSHLPVDRTDAALKFFGVALAGGSLVFASTMMSVPQREPKINGIEHFAIYAKPASHATVHEPLRRQANIDYTPVGSTRKALPPSVMAGYEILEVSHGTALIRLPEGRIMRVAPGERIAGLGGVTSIQQRQGKWIVATPSGAIKER